MAFLINVPCILQCHYNYPNAPLGEGPSGAIVLFLGALGHLLH